MLPFPLCLDVFPQVIHVLLPKLPAAQIGLTVLKEAPLSSVCTRLFHKTPGEHLASLMRRRASRALKDLGHPVRGFDSKSCCCWKRWKRRYTAVRQMLNDVAMAAEL